jgi:zinc-ribbon domain
MVCSSCGAEIADKAIVCYRCGTPTAIPAAPARTPPPRRPVWPAIATILVIVALALWLMPMTPPDSGMRYAAYAAVAAAVMLAAVLLIRRR